MEAGAPRGLALTGHVFGMGSRSERQSPAGAQGFCVRSRVGRTVTANDGAFTIQDPPAGDLMIGFMRRVLNTRIWQAAQLR